MITAVLIGGDQQALRGAQAHARQAGLTLVLIAVGVLVVEDLADDVGAIEGRIGHHAHRGRGRGDGPRSVANSGIEQVYLVDVLAFADAGANDQDDLDDHRIAGFQCKAIPGELPAVDRGLGLHAIELGGALDVLESGWDRVRDPCSA